MNFSNYRCDNSKCYDDLNNKIYDKITGESYEKDFEEQCENFDIRPTIIPHKERIIAIGDVHGDINKCIDCLKIANVIEEVNIINLLQSGVKIKEYLHNLTIKNNKSIRLDKTENEKTSYADISDTTQNQFNLVYRYYKINNEYYVKIIHNTNIKWFKWIGGNTYVVQVGDQIDRCRSYFDNGCLKEDATINDEDSDLEIMLFLDSLGKLARKYGGDVNSLLGNHEIMNVKGDMRYVSYKGLIGYSPEHDIKTGIKNRTNAFKTIIAKKMACTRLTVLVIGDYIFVHGGIALDLAYKYKLIDINSIIHKFLFDPSKRNDDIYTLLESSRFSPLWYRKLAFIPNDVQHGNQLNKHCKDYDKTINQLNKTNNYQISSEPTINIKGMVIGHTPSFTVFPNSNDITKTCNDTLFKIDVGISDAFNDFSNNITRKPQVLEILTNLKTKESTHNILKY
jgi:hypothetical protein